MKNQRLTLEVTQDVIRKIQEFEVQSKENIRFCKYN